MRIPRAALVFALVILITPRTARSADTDIVVTAVVQPKSIALKDLKADKPLDVTVSCIVENRTAVPQVINRFRTLWPSIRAGDRQIILNDRGPMPPGALMSRISSSCSRAKR
jgi:hypothetical protein